MFLNVRIYLDSFPLLSSFLSFYLFIYFEKSTYSLYLKSEVGASFIQIRTVADLEQSFRSKACAVNPVDSSPGAAMLAVGPVLTLSLPLGALAHAKTPPNSEIVPGASPGIFLHTFGKENQNTLVAILFITNKFCSLKPPPQPQPPSGRDGLCPCQRCLLNAVRILIADAFLRTRDSFCCGEAACSAKLSRKKEQIFLHDPGRLGRDMKVVFQGCLSSSIYVDDSLRGGYQFR